MEKFRNLPLLGILRGVSSSQIEPLVEAAISAGLGAIEITMNTVGAAGLIEQMNEVANGRLDVGAGTVLNKSDLNNALSANASFIVTPVFIKEISEQCKNKGIPIIPGALTPKEVFEAWQGGAEMIKLFPASCFGPKYIKELAGPFEDIKILACGGVGLNNIAEYRKAGASGAAFGGSIFRKEWLENGEYSKVEASITDLIAAYRKESD